MKIFPNHGMYVCVCTYMCRYVCMYVCMYVRMYTYMHAFIYFSSGDSNDKP